eukprot:TRINITY_DN3804_c0_g1_i1.p1 TRINITY_DN3804_c0_g1~~TRINITY_DN3804_c0_g1_i1.p1  ORF type:complete len:243 (+),score=8.39 TRINITY_DN3804_c0_g1_i1:120-848(+)
MLSVTCYSQATEDPKPSSLFSIVYIVVRLTHRYICNLVVKVFVSAANFLTDTIFSVICATPISASGFGYSSSIAGVAMVVYGCTLFLFMLTLYRPLTSLLGYHCAYSLAFFSCAVLWPSLPAIATSSFSPNMKWAFVLVYLVVRAVSGGVCFSLGLLFVSNSSTPLTLGRVTGMSDTIGGIFKAAAPASAGLIWAVSAGAGWFPVYPFASSTFVAVVSLVGFFGTFFVPEALSSPRLVAQIE